MIFKSAKQNEKMCVFSRVFAINLQCHPKCMLLGVPTFTCICENERMCVCGGEKYVCVEMRLSATS